MNLGFYLPIHTRTGLQLSLLSISIAHDQSQRDQNSWYLETLEGVARKRSSWLLCDQLVIWL